MKTLMELVNEGHVITETEHGDYCWTCTLASGIDTPHPCATLARAEELDAITPLEDVPEDKPVDKEA